MMRVLGGLASAVSGCAAALVLMLLVALLYFMLVG